MPLTPGTRLGPYEVLAPIGAGGMGDVYRAKDSKLDREVAIKVLPAAVARDTDGRHFLYSVRNQSKANEFGPNFGPSSDWLAYVSDETRRFEVYVQSFPTPGRKYQVSVNGGANPVWSRDGKELFFIAPDRQMMMAAVHKNGGNLEFGTPKALFDSELVSGLNTSFDVTKDGRFLIPAQEQGSGLALTLVLNWQAGLKK